MALLANGSVVAWGGLDDYGQNDLPQGLSNVSYLAVGPRGGIAITRPHRQVIAWGDDTFGQVSGMPNPFVRVGTGAVVDGMKWAVVGGTFSVASDWAGRLYPWGNNSYGQLNLPRSHTVSGQTVFGDSPSGQDIALGDAHGLLLDAAKGCVLCWGRNTSGQCNVPSDLQCNTPTARVEQIAAAGDLSVALLADGTVRAWGSNFWHQTEVPPEVADVVEVSASPYFVLARTRDNRVIGWGRNDRGQLPVGVTHAAHVAAGYNHGVAAIYAPGEDCVAAGECRAGGSCGTGFPHSAADCVYVESGDFRCQCPTGFVSTTGDGRNCVHDDICASNDPCHSDQVCTNVRRNVVGADFFVEAACSSTPFALGNCSSNPCGPGSACTNVTRSDGVDGYLCTASSAGDCTTRGVQNLVVLVGSDGAHAYPQLLFPHPDAYEIGRAPTAAPAALPSHFMQNASYGGTGSSLGGTLSNVFNYASPPASPAGWSAGERFKRVFGAGNQAFRGFTSASADSRAADQGYWGTSAIPSNVGGDPGQNWLVMARETPWLAKYGLRKAITGIEGGLIDPFPSATANNASVAPGISLMAAAARLQLGRPSVKPVVMVGSLVPPGGSGATDFYGSLPGAPAPLVATDAADMVVKMNVAGGAVDLTSLMTPTSNDRNRYGFTGTTPAKMAELRDRLIVTAKLLTLGLTNQVVVGYFDDDPDALFTAAGVDGANAATAAAFLGNVLNAFMDDLMAQPDPFCPGIKVGDNTVVVFVGDTPRNGLHIWPEVTRGRQNRTWVMSNGLLKSGFFGGDRPRLANDYVGEGGLYDLNSGDLLPFDDVGTGLIGGEDLRRQYGETAMAAVLYAVTRGDVDKVNRYYGGPEYPALVVPPLL